MKLIKTLTKLLKTFLIGASLISVMLAAMAFIFWALNHYPWIALSVFLGGSFVIMSMVIGKAWQHEENEQMIQMVHDEWNKR